MTKDIRHELNAINEMGKMTKYNRSEILNRLSQAIKFHSQVKQFGEIFLLFALYFRNTLFHSNFDLDWFVNFRLHFDSFF